MTARPGSSDGAPFRVATYNLYLGADLTLVTGVQEPEELRGHVAEVMRQIEATAFPKRAEAVAAALLGERADLVGLQEVCTWSADGNTLWDFQVSLLDALAKAGEPYDVVVEQSTFRGAGDVPLGDDGSVVRLHLTGSNVVLRRRRSHVAVLATDSGVFDEALTLPALGAGEVAITRGWCRVACAVGERHFDFVNTHTEAHDVRSRETQRDELVTALGSHTEPVVVVGDFNARPAEVGMPAAFIDAWVAAGHPLDGPDAGTYGQDAALDNDANGLRERIDYVWVRDLDVRRAVRIGDRLEDRTPEGLWPSDHAGVVAELALR